MYCRKCGKELPNDADFCSACGTSVKEKTNVEKASNNHITNEEKHVIRTDRLITVGIIGEIASWIIQPFNSDVRYSGNAAAKDYMLRKLNSQSFKAAYSFLFLSIFCVLLIVGSVIAKKKNYCVTDEQQRLINNVVIIIVAAWFLLSSIPAIRLYLY